MHCSAGYSRRAWQNGLLSAEADQWRVQRRTLAPMFSHKTVTSFAPSILNVANALVDRWRARGEGTQIDAAAEMTRVTLAVLEHTIFSDGLGCDGEKLRAAMATYFEAIGRLTPSTCCRKQHCCSRRSCGISPWSSCRATGSGLYCG